MNDEKKDKKPAAARDERPGDSVRELGDSELEDVAGGIAWHKKFDERTPASRWEKRDEW